MRRNRVFDTGGSPGIAAAYGMVTSYSVDVLDNMVSGVAAASGGNSNAFGIDTFANPSGSISGNRVRGLLKFGTGAAYGIYNESSGHLTLTGNHVVGDASAGSLGLWCPDANGNAQDNVISGFATGITGCFDGGNLIRP